MLKRLNTIIMGLHHHVGAAFSRDISCLKISE